MRPPADRPLALRGSWVFLYPPAWAGAYILAGEALLGSSGCGWGTSHSRWLGQPPLPLQGGPGLVLAPGLAWV